MKILSDSSVGTKLGFSFAVLCSLVLLCGITGWYGTQRLGDALTHVTGPAWDTADSSMEAQIGLQREVLAVHELINPAGDEAAARREFDAVSAHAQSALDRVSASTRLPAAVLAELTRTQSAYFAARQQLMVALGSLTGTPASFEAARVSYQGAANAMLQALKNVEASGRHVGHWPVGPARRAARQRQLDVARDHRARTRRGRADDHAVDLDDCAADRRNHGAPAENCVRRGDARRAVARRPRRRDRRSRTRLQPVRRASARRDSRRQPVERGSGVGEFRGVRRHRHAECARRHPAGAGRSHCHRPDRTRRQRTVGRRQYGYRQ